ncbi:MAG: hypothetical protein ACOYL6_10000 [Bacteriovoracaceae bacterium]
MASNQVPVKSDKDIKEIGSLCYGPDFAISLVSMKQSSGIFIVLGLLMSLATSLLWAQENPFRSLRDGEPERISARAIKQANKSFSSKEVEVIRTELENYYLLPLTTIDFLDQQKEKEFVKREIKSCKHSLRNVTVNCERFILKLLAVRLRLDHILDDVAYLLLTKGDDIELDLKTLEQKYFFVNLKREEINPIKAYVPFEFNPMNGKDFKVKVGKLKKLTPRQRLYLVYTPDQIIKMAEIIKKASTIMNSKSVQIVIDEDGDGKEDMDPIVLSYSGKYNLAIKVIKHSLEEETTTGKLIGKKPTYTDLLCASMEVGYFDANELKAMLALPELRDPKVDGWKKAGRIAWIITKAGIMAIPGWGPLIAIPVILVESIIEGQNENAKHADHSDDIF